MKQTIPDAEDDAKSASTVKSVEVAVQILDALADAPGAVRVTELSRALGMTKARVSRHLQTLTSLGLVDHAREGEGYVFGRKLFKFGRAAVYRSNVVEIARPYIGELCAQTGHTALLATPTKGGAMVVHAVPNPFEPGIMVQPGMVLSLPGSPAARLFYYFENRKPIPPRVFENLSKYGVDFETDTRGNGLGGIAAPVFEADGQICASVGLILSSSLLMPEPDVQLLAAVKAVTHEIQSRYAEGVAPPLMPPQAR
jgi:DNA-binding IclR family transcriptional regulator